MKSKIILDSSLAMALKKFLDKRFQIIRQFEKNTFHDNYTYRAINAFRGSIINSIQFSLLAKIIEFKLPGNLIFNQSVFVKNFKDNNRKYIVKMFISLDSSKIVDLLKRASRNVLLLRVSDAGIILVTGVIVNTLLAVIFKREISLFSWFLRFSILFISFGGLFCQADWREVIGTSWFLKWSKR